MKSLMRLGRGSVRDTKNRIYKGMGMEKQFDHVAHGDMPHFIIRGQLPSLNQYLSACARHPLQGASLKKQAIKDIGWCIRADLKNWHTDNPLIVHYVIYEPNTKRDKDNVFCMISKCTLDAMQECGVIKNDGWKNIVNFTHDFYISKDNARIEVYIEELKNESTD